MSGDIFLSYSRADQAVAEQFIKVATARGLSVWYDRMIEGGQDWRGKIVDALGSSKALVILFSEHSNDSFQLIKELAIADNMRKLVVPVLIAKCEPRGAYLYELASRNWVNICPNPETRLEPLVDTLMKELGIARGGPAAPVAPSHPLAEQKVAQNHSVAPSIERTSTAATTENMAPDTRVAPTSLTSLTPEDDPSWFPLKQRDLYVLAPILAFTLLSGFLGPELKAVMLLVCLLSFLGYLLVIASRNARLNRSILSGKSFASYVAVLAVGISPSLLAGNGQGGLLFGGLLFLSLLLAVAANVLQVLLRKIYQQRLFRSRIG